MKSRTWTWMTVMNLFAMLVLAVVASPPAQAQRLTVLHFFTNGLDGGNPETGLSIDNAGNLYGTTAFGGYTGGPCTPIGGCGTVFEVKHAGSGWIVNPLHDFTSGNDGAGPSSRVVFGPDGNLYGVAAAGGGGPCTVNGFNGCGVVFKLSPPPAVCEKSICPWTEEVLYSFSGSSGGGSDGASPAGDLIFDQAGNIYGTTALGGGPNQAGTVFELTPSNGGWTETILYSFTGGIGGSNDGDFPQNGVVFDASGNLFGTTTYGGGSMNCAEGCGTIFILKPSGSGWIESILHVFQDDGTDGYFPFAGLTSNGLDSFYGTTDAGGSHDGGTVFVLTYNAGGSIYRVLQSFAFNSHPDASLLLDATYNLYGTSASGGQGLGEVFELMNSNGQYTYTPLYDFNYGVNNDLNAPICSLVFDASGSLYGTASNNGQYGVGAVWKLTP